MQAPINKATNTTKINKITLLEIDFNVINI